VSEPRGGVAPRATLAPGSRLRLARKARLRLDRKSGRYMLLYPEKGLLLNGTAADVLRLCTGDLTVEAIVARLAQQYGRDVPGVEREVADFLTAMIHRGLVEDAPERRADAPERRADAPERRADAPEPGAR
jgi:coenzyme PQQ biosynthesis protein PqqD